MGTKTIIITALGGGKGPVTFRPAPRQPASALTPARQPSTNTAVVLGKRPAPSPALITTQAVKAVAGPPRKRERLTHLTPEEKLNRRKLKNRIAAQTARDRKKAKMTTLEETTTIMETEMEALQAENEALRDGFERLEAENTRLRALLAAKNEQPALSQPATEVSQEDEPSLTLGSAASINAPLQRDQVREGRPLGAPTATLLMGLLSSLLSPSSRTSSPTTRLPSHGRLEEMLATLQKGLPLSQAQTADLLALWRLRRQPPEPPP